MNEERNLHHRVKQRIHSDNLTWLQGRSHGGTPWERYLRTVATRLQKNPEASRKPSTNHRDNGEEKTNPSGQKNVTYDYRDHNPKLAQK